MPDGRGGNMNKAIEKIATLPKWLQIMLIVVFFAIVQALKFMEKIGDLPWAVVSLVIVVGGIVGYKKAMKFAKDKLK